MTEFDNVDRREIDLIRAGTYHPLSVLGPNVPAQGLRTAYTYARHHARLCWMCSPGGDAIARSTQREQYLAAQPLTTTYRLYGAGWHWLPPKVGRIDIVGKFRFNTRIANAQIQAQAILSDGATVPTNDNGAVTVLTLPEPAWPHDLPPSFNNSAFFGVDFTVAVSVTRALVATNAIVKSWLQLKVDASLDSRIVPWTQTVTAFWSVV